MSRLQAFCLFAFAAFVSFSIAGAHISLGLLALCILLPIFSLQTHSLGADKIKSRFFELRLEFELPFAAFLLICLLSSLLSHDPLDSILHLKNLTTVIGAYAVAHSLRQHPEWRRPALWVFLTAATLASLWGLAKYALGITDKVQGTQSTTMTWGAMATMFLLVTVSTAYNGKGARRRWYARAFCLPQFFALVLSFVRGAYVGLAAGGFYLLRRQWKRLLPAALAVAVVAAALAPAAVRERFLSIFDLQNPTVLVRFSQWQIGAKIIADHPFFGVGWHDLAPFTRQYARPDSSLPAAVNVDIFHIGHYHNSYVTLAVYSGLVGFAAFLWLLWSLWQQLGRAALQNIPPENQALVRACRAAMLGFLVTGMFDWTFGDAEVMTMFWFLIGLGLGQGEKDSSSSMAALPQ